MKHTNENTIPICNAFDVLSENTLINEYDSSNDHQPIAPSAEVDVDTIPSCDADSTFPSSYASLPNLPIKTNTMNSTDFVFRSKGLHIANSHIRHLLPKLDELRRICETFF